MAAIAMGCERSGVRFPRMARYVAQRYVHDRDKVRAMSNQVARRVARVQTLCERWAHNLESNANRTGVDKVRANAMLSHAETCRAIADILSGTEDDYLDTLERGLS